MLCLTACPEPGCTAPAEIVDRRTLPSTDAPTEHVKVRCSQRHWFVLPVSMLRSPRPVSGRLDRSARPPAERPSAEVVDHEVGGGERPDYRPDAVIDS
jgi:hypothetical protein